MEEVFVGEEGEFAEGAFEVGDAAEEASGYLGRFEGEVLVEGVLGDVGLEGDGGGVFHLVGDAFGFFGDEDA